MEDVKLVHYKYYAAFVEDTPITMVQVVHFVEGVYYDSFVFCDGLACMAMLSSALNDATRAVDLALRTNRDMRIL